MTFNHDPNALLDYTVNWAAWLETSDTIFQSIWECLPVGIIASSPPASFTDTAATVWITGGKLGGSYNVTNRITTTAGRVNDRTFSIYIEQD